MAIKFSEEQIKDIVEMYSNPSISQKQIGDKYGVSRTVIKRILKEENVYNDKRTAKKYYGDFDCFHVIDSPEKAYWLGFISADGCVVPPRKNGGGACVKIRLHPKDRSHLEAFIHFLNSNLEIKDRVNSGFSEGQPCIDLEINSLEMVNDLINLGVVPAKSSILKPPKINKEFVFDYIRGYFDGDGSISKMKNQNGFTFSFVGTKEMLSWIQDQIGCNQKLEVRNENSINCFYFRVGGNRKPYELLSKLYNGNICLKRKEVLFQELQSSIKET